MTPSVDSLEDTEWQGTGERMDAPVCQNVALRLQSLDLGMQPS
jgi:hypothetical protein